MRHREYYDSVLVRIKKGEGVVEKLFELVDKLQLKNDSISGVGTSDNITVGLYGVERQKYTKKNFIDEMEVTNILGNISTINNKPYLRMHIIFADGNLNVHGGHLNEAIISATCEVIINKIDEKVNRFKNSEAGLNLYDI